MCQFSILFLKQTVQYWTGYSTIFIQCIFSQPLRKPSIKDIFVPSILKTSISILHHSYLQPDFLSSKLAAIISLKMAREFCLLTPIPPPLPLYYNEEFSPHLGNNRGKIFGSSTEQWISSVRRDTLYLLSTINYAILNGIFFRALPLPSGKLRLRPFKCVPD